MNAAKPPRRPPRDVITVRVHRAAVEASLDRIAAHRTATTGKKFTRSDAHREALREYAARHDPAHRKDAR